MDPGRDAVMRYQVVAPVSRQPEAVPLEQLQPSPVPRTFGEPLEMTTPELLGERPPEITAVMVAEPAPIAAPAPSTKPEALTEIAEAPAAIDEPIKVAVPAPVAFEAPTHLATVETPTPAPVKADAVTQLPAPPAPQAVSAPDQPVTTVNAVLKRAAPQPTPVPETAAPAPDAQKAGAPISFRTPWVMDKANNPLTPVDGSDYIPGDEDATAGLVVPGS